MRRCNSGLVGRESRVPTLSNSYEVLAGLNEGEEPQANETGAHVEEPGNQDQEVDTLNSILDCDKEGEVTNAVRRKEK